MTSKKKPAQLLIQHEKIKELRTLPDWQFISDVKALSCYDEERNTHHVPSGRAIELLELANEHFKLTVINRLCVACAWFGRPMAGIKAKCDKACAHLGKGGALFLF